MGIVAESSDVQLPPEAATAFRDAIRSARVGIQALDPWLAAQSAPTRILVGRTLSWWKRCLGLTEPIVQRSLGLPTEKQ